MKKILLIIPILIIAVIVIIGLSLNSIIKKGVETIGSEAAGAPVRIRDVDISIFSGKGKIKGFFIGNPSGFQSESAMKLNAIQIALNVKSVFSDQMVIKEIFIDSPEITYEKGGSGDNINTILRNIEKFSGSTGTEKTKQKEQAEKKVVISDFSVKNGKVNVSITALKGEKITLDLPDIHMKDIGKGGQGATVSDAMKMIFAAVNKNVITAVAGSVTDVGKTAEQAVKGTVGKTVDSLKGIFGK